MRILLVSAEYPPESPGGLGNAIRNLALGLASAGAEPYVLSSLAGNARENPEGMAVHGESDGIPVYRIKRQIKRLKREPRWFWRFHDCYLPADCYFYSRSVSEACRSIVEKEKIDVVQFPDYKGEGFFFVSKRQRVPCVVRLATPFYLVDRINRDKGISRTKHRSLASILAVRLMRSLEQKPIRHAAAIASPSHSLAALIRDEVKPKGRIQIVPTGIDTGRFAQATAEETKRYRSLIGLGGETVVLFTGRYEYRKGVHNLIESFAEVHSRYGQCKLILAGGDTETAPVGGSMKRYLEKRVDALGLSEYVMLMDRVPHVELPLLYSIASVFVAPSLYENFANTILEALACGVPVISTTAGGASEIIDDPVNGRLVPPGDDKALTDAILELLADAKRCKITSKANAEKAREKFSREKMAKGFLELYESVL